MPRAHRGQFESPDHFVLGHFAILWPFSAGGSPQTTRRFIGLAIRVKTRASVNISFTVPSGTTRVRHRTKAEFALAWFGNGQSRIPCHVCPGNCWAEPPIMEGPKTDGASGMILAEAPFFNDSPSPGAFLCRQEFGGGRLEAPTWTDHSHRWTYTSRNGRWQSPRVFSMSQAGHNVLSGRVAAGSNMNGAESCFAVTSGRSKGSQRFASVIQGRRAPQSRAAGQRGVAISH
jgi:hypothetical protein